MTRKERYLVLGLESRDGLAQRLLVRYPDLRWTVAGAAIPLTGRSPEEILAVCRHERIRVLRSQVGSG
jgi:hypothetical protein